MTRVDTTRSASLARINPTASGLDRFSIVNLAHLWPEVVRLGWGDHGLDSWDLASILLLDALPDYDHSVDRITRFRNEVIAGLPQEGWELDWVEIWRWFLSTQLHPSAAQLAQLAKWKEELHG